MKLDKFILFIALIFAIFGIQNCKQDPCKPALSPVNETFNISDLNISKIPYSGFDTIVFLSDLGNTAILFGQGKNRHYDGGTSYSGLD